MVHITTVIE